MAEVDRTSYAASNHAVGEESPLLGDRVSSADNDESQAHESVPTIVEYSNKRLALTLASIWVGTFLAALDSTVIATLVTPISATFSSFSALSWLASAYLISNSAFQPLSGRLTDIFSRRSGLLFSNIFFCIGTLICGLATSEGMIIAGRVIAGIGGGGLNAISTFVASDMVPLRQRGVWQGIGNISWGLGSGIGGLYGGLINDVWGWRWAFLTQIPLIIISTLLVFFNVKVPRNNPQTPSFRRVDFLGAFTLVTALVLVLFGLNAGGNSVSWTHPIVLTTLPLSAVFFVLFIYVEKKLASEPIIPVQLMLDRTVTASCLVNWFITMAIFALLFYGPVYLQVAMKLSPAQSGLRLIPQSVGTAIGSLGSGFIMKATGKYYWLNISIGLLFMLAYAIACTLETSTPPLVPYIYFTFAGVSYGSILTVNLSALIAAVDHTHQAVVTSASYTFRSTGATIGITVASTLFQNMLKTRLWEKLGDREGAAEIIDKIRRNVDEVNRLPDSWVEPVVDCYMYALR
ncbi:MAG: hypothetical protein M1829_001359 [Trizodia sp. TS-e1964]|nr:MAG: hypothetical protein M1829_001359 [Trizodia sp. TS-e1964]